MCEIIYSGFLVENAKALHDESSALCDGTKSWVNLSYGQYHQQSSRIFAN